MASLTARLALTLVLLAAALPLVGCVDDHETGALDTAEGDTGDVLLDSALDTEGAARPSDAALQRVSEVRVRVYLSPAQVPIEGDLFLDAVRVR